MNNKQIKAHDFEEVYSWLGINLDKLGCVMLDLESLDIQISEDILYYSNNKERFWIKGNVVEKVPHITLLYGLLQEAKDYQGHINRVLFDWTPDDLEIENFGFFESPYKDESYYCVVAHFKMTPNLLEGHQRLEFLPHINTFAGYKPHMTIAYINKDIDSRDRLIKDLTHQFVGKKLKVTALNLGGNK